ncbi:MAG: T9SS type A sorting domain-containing protein [Bacteroidia bacterium]
MKKTFIYSLLLSALAPISGQAQSFEVYPKIVHSSGSVSEFELVGHAFVKNTGNGTTATWKRVSQTGTNGWTNAMCDNVTCWATTVDRNTILLNPGDSSILDLHFYPANNSGNSQVAVAVWIDNDSLNADTIYYFAETWPLSLDNVAGGLGAYSIFPNPTVSDATVICGNCTPSKIEVYTIQGFVSQVDIGSFPRLDLEFLPVGVYFLRVHSDEGVVIVRLVKAE